MNRKIIKYYAFILLFCLTALFAALAGCAPKPPEKGVFYTAGNWDIPPAFHGNPWAPGGAGNHEAFIYEPLFIYKPRSREFINRLGESFEEDHEQNTLTVHLKKNVYWHDGVEFTSRDVQTTFYIGYLKNLPIWLTLKDIECPDADTVVFKWKKRTPLNKIRALTTAINSPYHKFGEWAELIPDIRRQKAALKKGDKDMRKTYRTKIRKVREVLYKERPKMPVGTGPFKLTKATAADLVLEKFPKYYDADNVMIKKVRMQRWGKNEVVWSLLMSGMVDAVAPACPYDVAQEIKRRNPGTRLITPSDMSDFGLIFNMTKKPMSDMKFRKAVAYLLDRDGIRKVAYYYGTTARKYSLGIPESFRKRWISEEVVNSLTKYEHDPEKAKRILTDAGYIFDTNSGHWRNPDGSKIALEIVAPDGLNDLILLAEAASSQMTRFGIPTQVRVVSPDIYSTTLTDQKFDIAAENGARLTKFGHPSMSLDRFFYKSALIKTSSGMPDVVKSRNGEQINTLNLVDELGETLDRERTKEITGELAWVVNEKLPFFTVYEKNITIFTVDGKRVTGWPKPDDEIWQTAPGGVENLYCTLIVKGILRPAD